VNRKYRLTRSEDIKRVRRSGKTYAHPLVVLFTLPNQDEVLRIGVVAGRRVGTAVKRNRAKRLLRAATQPWIPCLRAGWDIMLFARQGLGMATFEETREALRGLFRRAYLFKEKNGD
jgi:ribonuclease P protein component